MSDALMAELANFEVYRVDMERGSRDTNALGEVHRLQRRLDSLLYLEGGIDGIFGGGTESALKYFQKRNKLAETGVADEETQRALFSESAVKSDRPKCMYMLKISVADQRVYAYKWVNGSYSQLVRTMKCSTGTTSDPTPLGTFTAGGPCGRWYYFKKFDCWAQYAYRINGRICSTPCSIRKRTPPRCGKARSTTLAGAPRTAACACRWRTPSGSTTTARRAQRSRSTDHPGGATLPRLHI